MTLNIQVTTRHLLVLAAIVIVAVAAFTYQVAQAQSAPTAPGKSSYDAVQDQRVDEAREAQKQQDFLRKWEASRR